MTKPGRPPKNGVKNLMEFFRAAEVVHAYIEEREKGTKYEAAIGLVIDRTKEKHPEMPLSRSTVKRIIALTCNKESGIQWKITKSIDPLSGREETALGFEEIKAFESAYKKRKRESN